MSEVHKRREGPGIDRPDAISHRGIQISQHHDWPLKTLGTMVGHDLDRIERGFSEAVQFRSLLFVKPNHQSRNRGCMTTAFALLLVLTGQLQHRLKIGEARPSRVGVF